jgi:Flp pilus assembly protein TadD
MYAEDWFQAEVEFEQLIVEYPAYPGPYVNLAILYRRDNRVAEAEASLNRALAIAPDHPAANSELGVLYRERGDFAEAESAYRRAIDGDPSYALAYYNLGVLYDLYLKREAEALEHYEAYLSLAAEPDAAVERWVVDLRRRLGLPAETAQVAQENGT